MRAARRLSGSARRRLGGALAVATLTGLATCTPPEPELAPSPAGVTSPEIRIGVLIGGARLEVTSDSGLNVLDADGNLAGASDPGAVWQARAEGSRLTATDAGGVKLASQAALTFDPRGGLLSLNGKWYRGRLAVVRDRSGLTAVNVVSLEDYLVGVVSSEMGRRDSSDAEALAAQAIVSRTFAVRNLGKRASDGFDLLPTVVDQAYAGVGTEYPLARWAVTQTAGQIVTWQGVPIDAFFFSTCGGRTATGTEVYAAADRPYLVSIRDLDADGQAYCRISPRFRWREEWTADQLREVLRQSLPPATGAPADSIGDIQGVTVTRRTGSDRVSRVTVQLSRSAVSVDGPAVRSVLHPVGEPYLRSALFQLTETREGGRLTRLVAEGSGAGHGVGFCQWGAVGRARAGQDAATILSAYFPGTDISRAY